MQDMVVVATVEGIGDVAFVIDSDSHVSYEVAVRESKRRFADRLRNVSIVDRADYEGKVSS